MKNPDAVTPPAGGGGGYTPADETKPVVSKLQYTFVENDNNPDNDTTTITKPVTGNIYTITIPENSNTVPNQVTGT